MTKYHLIFLISFLLFLFSTSLHAQSIEQLHNEIDQQVWKPFIEAFEGLDGEALNKLYAESVLRVTPAGVDTEETFKVSNLRNFKQRKAAGATIKLDFWLDTRQTTPSLSYEIGFFRITSTLNGNTNINYGQFHIVLEKINGVWKITQDWDSGTVNGKELNAEDFARKKPLSFNR